MRPNRTAGATRAPDARAAATARARQQRLTKPPGSLGRLEDLACWFAARQGTPLPELARCEIFVFAADHGVAAEGVSAFPQAVTGQMLSNFARGGAAINVLARLAGCRIEVVDVGVLDDVTAPQGVRSARVRAGTRNLYAEAAMTDEELAAALSVGERCAREGAHREAQLLIAGDMGIANTTAAACLISALTGADPLRVVGRGTGVDDAGLARKLHVVAAALDRARKEIGISTAPMEGQPPDSNGVRIDPGIAWEILRQLGGFELAAMAGLYIEAARAGIPTLLDGYISGAAALAAVSLEPAAREWMQASHRSAEAGHGIALESLGLKPVLDLSMRLGEGTGAAVTLPIIRAALELHRNMATFDEAGVSDKAEPA